MMAKRVNIFGAIFTKRSSTFYGHFKERAKKQFAQVPFTLADFRDWLDRKLEPGGVARCEYSGDLITIEDLSIDHRIPVSRGGSFALDNLALCSEKQNLRKGNMTKDEFIRLKEYVSIYLPIEVQESIWKRLEIGDVQRFSHYRRQKKLAHQ